jgi:hypothetical protein
MTYKNALLYVRAFAVVQTDTRLIGINHNVLLADRSVMECAALDRLLGSGYSIINPYSLNHGKRIKASLEG